MRAGSEQATKQPSERASEQSGRAGRRARVKEYKVWSFRFIIHDWPGSSPAHARCTFLRTLSSPALLPAQSFILVVWMSATQPVKGSCSVKQAITLIAATDTLQQPPPRPIAANPPVLPFLPFPAPAYTASRCPRVSPRAGHLSPVVVVAAARTLEVAPDCTQLPASSPNPPRGSKRICPLTPGVIKLCMKAVCGGGWPPLWRAAGRSRVAGSGARDASMELLLA
ncbi:hypothetical protein E2C01_031432 [Portunus trituberculatus]|uniref:Uncharacterized protein n=1 Tax=Portunus trituberculatus TaxID=210409 RepID=A0A5B7EXN4_PORTR|nr:hypothetical protein [Portunus trituberculatus]